MAVMIGSARIDENGKTTGGLPGDQTGKEVAVQKWYLHSKGWVVLRPRRAEAAAAIARNMQAACDNDLIGYDQSNRLSALAASEEHNYDLSKVTVACETDCSALVRVCCLYAGIKAGNFSTASQVNVLRATGEFDVLTDAGYCKSSDYLLPGDILVTKSQGHTVVVLSPGAKVTSGGPSVPESQPQPVQKKVAPAMYKASELAGVYHTTADLHMRYKPGLISPDNVICVIPAGKAVRCYGYYNDVQGVKWYLIAYQGREGHVSGKYLRRS